MIRSLVNSILLTFDVEDWFQVENFKQCIQFSSWPDLELRVEKNTHRLLDLLDSIELDKSTSTRSTEPDSLGNARATFFVLGWIAQRLPVLVREIQRRGHEVGSHGYHHRLCTEESVENLRRDLVDSKKLLEDITGADVHGYRAPSFSINRDILRIIQDSGYTYDSSYNSFELHKRYGQVQLAGGAWDGIACQVSDTFYELPVSNLKVGRHVLPWGGGGYFRVMPLPLFERGVRSILKKDGAYLFYLHPWEIDPDQPRVRGASRSYLFRHYTNLKKTSAKLSFLAKTFGSNSFVSCQEYLQIR